MESIQRFKTLYHELESGTALHAAVGRAIALHVQHSGPQVIEARRRDPGRFRIFKQATGAIEGGLSKNPCNREKIAMKCGDAYLFGDPGGGAVP